MSFSKENINIEISELNGGSLSKLAFITGSINTRPLMMWPEPEEDPETGFLGAARTPGGNAAFHNFHNDFSHILDPNQRRRLALAEIDKVPFGWYHVRAIAVAGAGFFADSYDLFAINLAIQMLGISFWQEGGGEIPANIQTAINASTSAGAIIGQILFGWLADTIGRKKMYGVELIILVVATLGQSLSSPSTGVSMSGLLIFGRVMMGLGIGGGYPMSAVITSEFAPARWRGAMMAAVFSMQSAGQFAAAMVALVTTVGFRKSFSTASSASTYRITIPETPRFTFDITRDIEKADADIKAYIEGQPAGRPDGVVREQTKIISKPMFTLPRSSWSDFCTYFSKWRNGSVLFATTASWFLVDFAFHGLGLKNSTILAVIGYSSGSDVYQILYNSAVGNLILVCAGSLPGYWLSALTVDFGRKPIQIGGFIILTIIFCIIGFAYNSLNRPALLALYILAQLFFNFGPNTTTFIIPGECFPTRYRSTCHGLSAASGKLGATIAQIIAHPLLVKGAPAKFNGSACSPWLDHLMEIFACFMLCGILVSFLVPETKRQTLEVLAGEAPLPRRDGNSAGRGRKGGFLFGFGLWLHFLSNKEGGKSQAEGNGRHGAERADDDYVEAANRDYSMSVSTTGNVLRSPRPNEDESYEQQRVGTIPLQDVGMLLSVLK